MCSVHGSAGPRTFLKCLRRTRGKTPPPASQSSTIPSLSTGLEQQAAICVVAEAAVNIP